jgi:hypothetical protein
MTAFIAGTAMLALPDSLAMTEETNVEESAADVTMNVNPPLSDEGRLRG